MYIYYIYIELLFSVECQISRINIGVTTNAKGYLVSTSVACFACESSPIGMAAVAHLVVSIDIHYHPTLIRLNKS